MTLTSHSGSLDRLFRAPNVRQLALTGFSTA